MPDKQTGKLHHLDKYVCRLKVSSMHTRMQTHTHTHTHTQGILTETSIEIDFFISENSNCLYFQVTKIQIFLPIVYDKLVCDCLNIPMTLYCLSIHYIQAQEHECKSLTMSYVILFNTC